MPVKSAYHFIETLFEKFSTISLKVFSNSITFIVAVVVVIFWLLQADYSEGLHGVIRDVMLAITFLSFFIIQKTQNRLSAATHLKLNELVKAQENASNMLINVEKRSQKEIEELARELHSDENDQPQ